MQLNSGLLRDVVRFYACTLGSNSRRITSNGTNHTLPLGWVVLTHTHTHTHTHDRDIHSLLSPTLPGISGFFFPARKTVSVNVTCTHGILSLKHCLLSSVLLAPLCQFSPSPSPSVSANISHPPNVRLWSICPLAATELRY